MSTHTTPYSTNIIFLDTEFSDFNPKIGELLSIGLVKYSGEELYLELEHNGPVDPWVVERVLPHLSQTKINRAEACEKIKAFIGSNSEDQEPYLVAYVNQFDAIYWYKLFGSPKDHPAYWIPIDFASILFGLGYSPNSLGKHQFFKQLGIDKSQFQEHNALDDARLLREVYLKFFSA